MTALPSDRKVRFHCIKLYNFDGIRINLLHAVTAGQLDAETFVHCRPLHGTATVRASRCWITLVFQGEELYNI